jgi:dephospho-CoA kinase
MRPKGNRNGPLRIIVSGGIGSGKSTVSMMLRRRGAVVIEADRIGHEILQPGGAAFEQVAERWPAVVVDGRIDRSRLAAVVFTDGEQLALLEAITHPHIRAEIEARIAENRARDVVVEVPHKGEFVEGNWIRLVVDAPPGIRLQRTVERGMDHDDVANRMAAQPSPREWNEIADVVIDNRGSLADLEAEVDRVWRGLIAARSS